MRRLLAALLVLPALAVPAGAAAKAPPAVLHEAGRVWLVPGTGADALHRRLESAATGPLAKQVLRAYDLAVAEAGPAPQSVEIHEVFSLGDLDGDKVGDVLSYDARLTFSRGVPTGDVTLAVYSGRTGSRRWAKKVPGMALAYPYEVKVGSGKAGLLLARAYDADGDFHSDALRVVGLGGARGDRVYDRTVTDKDGLGRVLWGGVFDAISGGGTEVLIGRVKATGDVDQWLSAETTTPYLLDGRNGKVTALGTGTPGVSSLAGFLATGDLNADGKDDMVGIRRAEGDVGTVTAFSGADGLPLWTSPPVTVGWGIRVAGLADMSGDKRRDILLETWVSDEGPLEIEDVTDGIPVVDQTGGVHGILIDAAGLLQWDRTDGVATYLPVGDIDKKGKTDVLVVAEITGARTGLRFIAVDAAGTVIYQREVSVPTARQAFASIADIALQGDLDADGVTDLAYLAYSFGVYDANVDSGFFLAGRNQIVRKDGFGLLGTVDGRGDELLVGYVRGDALTVTVRDGVNGPAYWTATVTGAPATSWDVRALSRTRGKCGGVLLIGRDYGGASSWLASLDGGTGKLRWKRAMRGRAPQARFRSSGPQARCR